MSFAKQASLATVVVAASVGGLWILGRGDGGASLDSKSTETKGQQKAAAEPLTDLETPREKARSVRDLVPANAWLVADFQGDLTGQKPFADQPGLCASVPPPERVVMAVLPPLGDNNPDLLIAARKIEETFWGCARDRIVRAGGTALAQNDQYEVLKSPSGVVARGPLGAMVFLTSEKRLEDALASLSDLKEGAGTSGSHAELLHRIYQDGAGPENSVLDVTLWLPSDWLSSVGQDKEKTPLRFMRSAFVSARTDGSAHGGIDCEESGCAEVLEFLERAQADLLTELPAPTKSTIKASLSMQHLIGTGGIRLDWKPAETSLGALLGQIFGPGVFGD